MSRMPAGDDPGTGGVLERFDRAADRYESWYETRSGALAAKAERRLLASLLGPEATSDRALEVGCGTGYFTEWLDDQYTSVVGLDPAPAMLRELRRRRRTFPIVRGDAHRLPFENGAFEAVLFLTTLEFLDDPEVALREAVRVARSQIVLLWLNPWSVGAIKRRLAPGFLLSQAKSLSRRHVQTMLTRSAGSRARGIEWAGTLFPWPMARVVAKFPLGDVLAIKLSLTPPITDTGTHSERLEEALREALDDEYKARATYRAVLAKYGDVRPFVNIVESEGRHIGALARLFDRYGFEMPEDPWPTRISAPESLEAACATGVEAEIENRALYERLMVAAVGHPDVEETFRNLQSASQDNHLPAFERALERERGGRGSDGSEGPGRRQRRRHRGGAG